jgi:hypothetical protein
MLTLPITKEQANYLNVVARTAYHWRVDAQRIVEDLQASMRRVENGHMPERIRPQDSTDIAKHAAELDALENSLFWVFPFPVDMTESPEDMAIAKAHEARVMGYFKEAVKLGDGYIFIQH